MKNYKRSIWWFLMPRSRKMNVKNKPRSSKFKGENVYWGDRALVGIFFAPEEGSTIWDIVVRASKAFGCDQYKRNYKSVNPRMTDLEKRGLVVRDQECLREPTLVEGKKSTVWYLTYKGNCRAAHIVEKFGLNC